MSKRIILNMGLNKNYIYIYIYILKEESLKEEFIVLDF